MPNGKLYRCEVYMPRWELPRNRGLNLIPQSKSLTLSFAYLLFNSMEKKSARINDPISTKGAENKHW